MAVEFYVGLINVIVFSSTGDIFSVVVIPTLTIMENRGIGKFYSFIVVCNLYWAIKVCREKEECIWTWEMITREMFYSLN